MGKASKKAPVVEGNRSLTDIEKEDVQKFMRKASFLGKGRNLNKETEEEDSEEQDVEVIIGVEDTNTSNFALDPADIAASAGLLPGIFQEKRRPGRPVTTGEYEIKKKKEKIKAAQEELSLFQWMYDTEDHPPDKRDKTWGKLKSQKEIEGDLRNAPTADVYAQMMTATKAFEKGTKISKNLQGPLKKLFNETVLAVSAGISILASRNEAGLISSKDSSSDLEALRAENQTLKKELGELRDSFNKMQSLLEDYRKEIEKLENCKRGGELYRKNKTLKKRVEALEKRTKDREKEKSSKRKIVKNKAYKGKEKQICGIRL